MVAIGEINGDGEVVCFSKNEGIFVRVFEGKTTEINDFACVLKEIIKLMDDKPILSQERYLEILQKIKEKSEKIKKTNKDTASVTRSVPVFWLYDRGTRDTH